MNYRKNIEGKRLHKKLWNKREADAIGKGELQLNK